MTSLITTDLVRLLQGVDALVVPTRPAAWKNDAVHGDMSPGGNAIVMRNAVSIRSSSCA